MDSEKIMIFRNKNPDRIPVIINPINIQSKNRKFIIKNDLTLGAFVAFLRRHHLVLGEEQGMVVLIGSSVPKMSATICELDERYRSADNCLHLTIIKENIFG